MNLVSTITNPRDALALTLQQTYPPEVVPSLNDSFVKLTQAAGLATTTSLHFPISLSNDQACARCNPELFSRQVPGRSLRQYRLWIRHINQ